MHVLSVSVPALAIAIPFILLVIILYSIGMWKFMGWWSGKLKSFIDSKMEKLEQRYKEQ